MRTIVAGLLLLACAVIVLPAIPPWVRRVRHAGGHWCIVLIVFAIGPFATVVRFGQTWELAPPTLSTLLTPLCWAVALIAVVASAMHARRSGPIVLALVSFYTAMILSAFWGAVPSSFPTEYVLTPLLLIPFALNGQFSSEWLLRVGRRFLRAVAVVSMVVMVAAPDYAFSLTAAQRDFLGFDRLQGITTHPNTLGILMCALVLLEAHSGRLLWLGFAAIPLVLSQSATSWIAAAFGLLIVSTRAGRAWRIAAALAATATVAVLVTSRDALDQLDIERFTTLTGRTRIWDAALAGLDHNWLFGYGPTLLDEGYRATYLGDFDAAGQAHNQFVQSLGQSGLFGLLTLLTLVAGLGVLAWRARHASHGLSLALMLVLLLRSLTETPLRAGAIGPTLLFLALVIGYIVASQRMIPPPVSPSRPGTRYAREPWPRDPSTSAITSERHNAFGIRTGAAPSA